MARKKAIQEEITQLMYFRKYKIVKTLKNCSNFRIKEEKASFLCGIIGLKFKKIQYNSKLLNPVVKNIDKTYK